MKRSKLLQGSKDLLHRSFKPDKCKTSLRLVMSRLKLLRNKKEVQVKHMRREISQLLESGQDQTARIRVEHVVREEKMMSAYELIALYSELIMARMTIIESQKNCPIDLKEAITSIIFASPRCGDVPELEDVRKQFTAKYGKDFINAAIELRPDCGVSRLLIEKLSSKAPDGQAKLKILTAIAEEYSIQWDPKSFGDNEATPPNDLLSGPTTFEDYEPPQTQTQTQTPTQTQTHDQALKPVESQVEKQSFPTEESSYMERKTGKMEFKDAGSAAQAAAESAEQAAMAARAAAEFANRERVTKPSVHLPRDKHLSSESESEQFRKDSTSSYTHPRSRNEQVEHGRYENLGRDDQRYDQGGYDSPKRHSRQTSSRSNSSFDGTHDAENYSRDKKISGQSEYDSPKGHIRQTSSRSKSSFDGTQDAENYSRDKKISGQSEYDSPKGHIRQTSPRSKSSFDGTQDAENYSRDKKISGQSEYDSPTRHSRQNSSRSKSSFDGTQDVDNYSRKSPSKEDTNISGESEYDGPKRHIRQNSSRSKSSFDGTQDADNYSRKSLSKEDKNISGQSEYDSPTRHSRKSYSRSEASFDDDSLAQYNDNYSPKRSLKEHKKISSESEYVSNREEGSRRENLDYIHERNTSKQRVTSFHDDDEFSDFNESQAVADHFVRSDYERIHIGISRTGSPENSGSDNDTVVYDTGPKFDEPHSDVDILSSGRASPVNVFSNPDKREFPAVLIAPEDEVKFDDLGPTKFDHSDGDDSEQEGNQIHSSSRISFTEQENRRVKSSRDEYEVTGVQRTDKKVVSPKIPARGPPQDEELSELELSYSHEGEDSDRSRKSSEGLVNDESLSRTHSELGSKLNFENLTGGLRHKKYTLPPYTRKAAEVSSKKDFESLAVEFPSSRNTNVNADHKSDLKTKNSVDVSDSDSCDDELPTRRKPFPTRKAAEVSSMKDFESPAVEFPSSRNTNVNVDRKSDLKTKNSVDVSDSDSSDDELPTRRKPFPTKLKGSHDFFGSESEEDLPKRTPAVINTLGDRISRRTKPTPSTSGTSKVRPTREELKYSTSGAEKKPMSSYYNTQSVEEPESEQRSSGQSRNSEKPSSRRGFSERIPDSKTPFRQESVKSEAVEELEYEKRSSGQLRNSERPSSRRGSSERIPDSKTPFRQESVTSEAVEESEYEKRSSGQSRNSERPSSRRGSSERIPDSKTSFRQESVKSEAVEESEYEKRSSGQSRNSRKGSSEQIPDSKTSFHQESVKSAAVEQPASQKKVDDAKDSPKSSQASTLKGVTLNRVDSSNKPSHVHPNLPDADSFFAAFRKNRS